MGQHKRNPTAILAKDGKLPPKEPNMVKRELEQIIELKAYELMYKKFGRGIFEIMSSSPYSRF